MDVLRCIEYFIDSCPITDHICNAQVYIVCDIVHPLVPRCGFCANSERTEDLTGIAVVMSAYFGNQYIAFLDNPIRLVLCRYAYRWILHGRGSHIVNVGLAI